MPKKSVLNRKCKKCGKAITDYNTTGYCINCKGVTMLNNKCNLGKKRSEFHRLKMSETAKKYNVVKNIPSRVGIRLSTAARIKIRLSKIGNKNPNWKGGFSPILVLIRVSARYRQWRQSVFIRDNFTCQDCGQHGGYLEVHHKKPFKVLIEEVVRNLPLLSLYDGAMIYEPFWAIDNGKTLCLKCHKKHRRN